MAAQAGVGLIITICSVFVIADKENACKSPSGFSTSSSCSSYLYCDQLGVSREGKCEEGKLWNKELEFCDFAANVTCRKDLFWLLRKGSSFLTTGLRLASVAHRVTANLLGQTAASNTNYQAGKDNEKGQPFIKERFGSAETRTFATSEIVENVTSAKETEEIIKVLEKMQPNPETKPSQEKEGSGSYNDDTEYEDDDYDDEDEDTSIVENVTSKKEIDELVLILDKIEPNQEMKPSQEKGSGYYDYSDGDEYGYDEEEYDTEFEGGKKSKINFAEQDKISITNFEHKNVALIEQPEETTPAFVTPEVNQLLLQKNTENLSATNKENKSGMLSPYESILPGYVKKTNQLKASKPGASLPWIVSKWVPETLIADDKN